jgi:hypothetical protein
MLILKIILKIKNAVEIMSSRNLNLFLRKIIFIYIFKFYIS